MEKNVVAVRLFGGLGNQMFQYAAARAVALRCAAPLVLDTAWFGTGEAAGRHFGLDHLRIQAQARPFSGGLWNSAPLRRIGARLAPRKSGLPVHRERSFRYDEAWDSVRAPVYLQGYFQSERYFAAVREVIESDFQPAAPPRPDTRGMLDRIVAADAICAHIRRGDYVSNPTVAAYHGLTSLDYYRRGVARLAAGLPEPHCFVFSDDPAWVRDNLRLDLPFTVVDLHGPDEPHEDLRLMAACRSFVIANSSLSWWGAWLGRHPGKQVVAPARWFLKPGLDTRDLIPDGWIRD